MSDSAGGQVNYTPIDILLVEDNEADVKITLRAFQQARLTNNVTVVHDGQEALDYLMNQGQWAGADHRAPNLILLDINLPKLDGFHVLDALKGNDRFSIIPVIMLTSSVHDEDVVRSYKGGAVSYIQKPVDHIKFMEMVNVFNFYWNIVSKLPPRR